MERIEEFSVEGKNFLYIDFSGFSAGNEFISFLDYIKPVFEKYPEQSIYTITNIENIRFDSRIKEEIVKYMAHNKPYVICGAIIGIDGIKKIMAQTIIKLSGRSGFHFYFTREEAVKFLLTQ